MSSITKKAYENFKAKLQEKERKASIEKIMITTGIIIAIVTIIVLAILISNAKKSLSKTTDELPTYAENLNIDKFKDTVEEVRDQGEMRRMKTYLGDIFDNISNKNYEEIYARLDDRYKEGFFPRQEVLKDYLEGEFPEDPGYTIKNFERIGTQYVYLVDVLSVKDSRKKTDMTFVFEEYGLNDYKFSFSKK